jgi:hypothetical protein
MAVDIKFPIFPVAIIASSVLVLRNLNKKPEPVPEPEPPRFKFPFFFNKDE